MAVTRVSAPLKREMSRNTLKKENKLVFMTLTLSVVEEEGSSI